MDTYNITFDSKVFKLHVKKDVQKALKTRIHSQFKIQKIIGDNFIVSILIRDDNDLNELKAIEKEFNAYYTF
jgi:hypothetical protein